MAELWIGPAGRNSGRCGEQDASQHSSPPQLDESIRQQTLMQPRQSGLLLQPLSPISDRGLRSVAQPGRALCSGRRGRRFVSSHSDHHEATVNHRAQSQDVIACAVVCYLRQSLSSAAGSSLLESGHGPHEIEPEVRGSLIGSDTVSISISGLPRC